MGYKKINGTTIRLAFLGCGAITKRHARTVAKMDDIELFFASRSGAKALSYQQKLKGKGHFASYEAALASSSVNTVFIATPPDSHFKWALAAVQAGKHVIIEKPPFLASEDFDKIEAAAEETGVQVMIAENYFYKPLRKKLKKLLDTGVIGDIKFLYFNATKTQTQEDWRNDPSISGGGALFEGGIHWINFINNLGWKIKKITGFQPEKRYGQLERSMQVVAQFDNGAVGTLLYSWEINALINGLRISRIYGTAGSITFESNGVFIFIRGKKWRFIIPGFADIGGSKAMFKDFFQAIRSGTAPAFDLKMAKQDLMFVEQAYASAKES